MRFTKGIQFKIATWTGIALLGVSVALTGFASLSMFDQQVQGSRDQAMSIAKEYASRVESELLAPLNMAQSLADAFAAIKEDNLATSREEVSRMLRSVLQRHPELQGVYTLWEPDAFDGQDQMFVNAPAHDETGRFMAYWNRVGGSLATEPLYGYDDPKDGGYYLNPRRTGKPAVVDPIPFVAQGREVLLVSVTAPIMYNGAFHGIVGVDVTVERLAAMAEEADFFEGTGVLAIISNNGTLAGVTGQPDLTGKNAKALHEDFDEDIKSVQAGKIRNEFMDDVLEIFYPVKIGTGSPWAVNLLADDSVVVARAWAMAWKMIWVGLGLLLVAVGVIWWLAGILARPVKYISRSAELAAIGDVDMKELDRNARDRMLKRGDELGEAGRAFASMVDYFRDKAQAAKKIADGDLTVEIHPASPKDELGNALERMVHSLNGAMGEIQTAAAQVAAGSSEVSDSSQSMSQGATEQASSLEEITSSLTEINSQTKTNAENAAQASRLSDHAKTAATQGEEHMGRLTEAMGEINESSQSIGKIIKVIDEIAFQTNLLALNAAVEAARAGKHGKGFAVVAEEVRTLASRSAKAAQETAQLIEGSADRVATGGKIAQETAEALTKIVENVTKSADLVQEIAAASNEQAEGVAQVNQGLHQVETVVQRSTATAEETASAAEELSSQSATLREVTGRFRIRQEGGERPLPQAPNPTPSLPQGSGKSDSPVDSWGDDGGMVDPEETISLDDDFGKY
ncbi:methyl-accepting chemotaxis sensory transducer with Cache sensor [Paucidesulfovibrio gracilis DSM 16080]|uniref:Methyl-accepting chemotaxis sensory transducer with Cache sensor n=1 Tax=Paucidesulfovibrio gracilis DSM 16080 TaxID=1121449 RepID=A0A1T4XJT9_9BACT|nr:methyl-accepting chemotaxis protein [Paucidesulfovibrio gracilis]SKA89777.1 methyl-accepting chemotaxis sensory transducer with Cache sensor [Paucidesulfovibrio gracilis DSM 16080]